MDFNTIETKLRWELVCRFNDPVLEHDEEHEIFTIYFRDHARNLPPEYIRTMLLIADDFGMDLFVYANFKAKRIEYKLS